MFTTFRRKGEYSELSSAEQFDIPLRSDSNRQHRIRNEQILEAELLPGDNIQTISLRFNCSVQDIKRLNKIDKDNEIFAFKVVKVPLTAQNVLLDTIPKVHKSGQSSPKNIEKPSTSNETLPSREKLEEKLLVASVSNAVITTSITKSEDAADREADTIGSPEDQPKAPLLNRSQFRGYPRTFGAPKHDIFTFNGSDCELNWIFLLICILAVCVIVPLIYVYMVHEHPERFHPQHSIYDDPK